jgi:uncharacterized membrane protein YcaP (DUF421 family)
MQAYLDIVFRSIAVYAFVVLAIRFFGKKEISQLSVTDLVFILLISNSVQNAMVGPNTSLIGGLVAALSLFSLNYLIKFIAYRNNYFSKFIEGEPVLLVYKGFIKQENLKKEKITLFELEAVVREHGLKRVEDAELVMLERDGNISVVSKNLDNQSIHKRKNRMKNNSSNH